MLDDRAAIIKQYVRYPWLDAVHLHCGSQGVDTDFLVASAKDVVALVEPGTLYSTPRSTPMLPGIRRLSPSPTSGTTPTGGGGRGGPAGKPHHPRGHRRVIAYPGRPKKQPA